MKPMLTFTRLLILLPLLAAGCVPSRPLPVVVEVADARTGDPLPGVIVRATGGTLYAPTMQPSILGGPGAMLGPLPDPEGAVAETDVHGSARLTIAGQRPVALRFFKEGYPEGQLTVTTSDLQVQGASRWTMEPSVPGVVRSMPLAGVEDDFIASDRPEMMFRVTAQQGQPPVTPP